MKTGRTPNSKGVLMKPKTNKSIHELPPLETGGVEARRGFGIQDHVGARFCLELLDNPHLRQVWCETQDDLTLIWNKNGQDDVEFVQVKGDEFDQLWSVAKLCERKRKNGQVVVGSSILERSLVYDRCSEPCCFRLVTTRPVQNELKPLTYALGSHGRSSSQGSIESLIPLVGDRVGNFKSENNNGHDYWVSHAVWEEIHSFESIKNENLLKLSRLVEAEEEHLFSDQLDEWYQILLTVVHNAALARWRDDPERKKFKKANFVIWFRRELTQMVHPTVIGGGRLVREKMARANLPTDVIATANDQRRRYREETLKQQYLKTRDMRLVEDEVIANLHALRSQLDAGIITDSGVEFHARCLQRLSDVRSELPLSIPPPLVFLHGCMYNIVDRCLHRFVRAET